MRTLFSNRDNGDKHMKIICQIWLDNNGKAFGKGPCELLNRIEVTGSLNKAASQMGMSYSKAWRLMGDIEKNWALLS